MQGRQRIRRIPAVEPTQELFMIQGELKRSDAFTIAQLAVMRMFDTNMTPLFANMDLGDVRVSKIVRKTGRPDQVRSVHAQPIQARFSTAEASEAAIDTTSFPYGSIGALGSLAVGSKPDDWDENVADMSYSNFSDCLSDIELHAKLNKNGLFICRSYLEIIKSN